MHAEPSFSGDRIRTVEYDRTFVRSAARGPTISARLSTRRVISYYSTRCDACRERHAPLPRDRPPPLAALRHAQRSAC
ncbi:hypothetical protein A8H40_04245 [Burkholderia multivorans]|uniref:Uncharacterized protein n=1 Tax=Burkholderia multivorans TaxID=87883 RepID=A0A8E2RWV4_9BURK|nr:hypothetical protein A8H40_04245 [Burkholderia multivorans]EJO57560.1 hypothetical protein BURMUCF1_A0264 [Burkholderia multivorans ATCC BAA-247]PRD90799.1 hypothetical protein C6P76_03120 [Burkholderia multivorans]PRE13958.1 hypothetical protein C6P92_17515 [Burkholderia multivorans]PRE26990.1 hypothetical protein C6P79_15830 [Burkholderia multivorans]